MPLSYHLQLTFYKKTVISYLSLHQSVAFMNHRLYESLGQCSEIIDHSITFEWMAM